MLSLAAVFCVAGCSAQEPAAEASSVSNVPTIEVTETPTPEPTVEVTKTPEPSPTPSYTTFGTESPSNVALLLTNETGQDITGIRLRNSDSSEYDKNMIPDDAKVVAGEEFRLYIDPAAVDAAASAEASEGSEDEPEKTEEPEPVEDADGRSVVFNKTYDMELTFEDETEAVLYDIGLDDLDKGEICYSAEDKVAYLKYTSLKTNEPVDTLQAQIARSRDEAAAREEEGSESEESSSSGGSSQTSSGSSTGSQSSSSGGGSSDESESSGSGGSSEESESSGGSSEEESSGGESSEESGGSEEEPSGGGSEEESSGGESGGEAEPEQEIGDCIEDNVVWND